MMHRHYDDTDPLSERPCVEIAPDVCLREWRHEGKLVRFLIAHDSPGHPDGLRCEGTIPVTGDKARQMTGSLAGGDLTLSPSIREPPSNTCPGQHGWVRDGKWVPA